MRFLYKIHSNFDGFRPGVLPNRMEDGRLRLRWRHYIDVVEKGWECWVYFHGRHKFENGVYAKGIVDSIDLEAGEVSLRVREYTTNKTDNTPEDFGQGCGGGGDPLPASIPMAGRLDSRAGMRAEGMQGEAMRRLRDVEEAAADRRERVEHAQPLAMVDVRSCHRCALDRAEPMLRNAD